MAIDKNFTAVKYDAGDVIISKGQKGDKLAYIMDGSVEILQTKDGEDELQAVAVLNKGNILGEMALLTGAPRNATARAVGETWLIWVNKRTFNLALINEDLPILKDMVSQIALRLEEAESKNVEYQQRIIELEAKLAGN